MKRGLYKPAQQNEVTKKERRKPLAQGRLITQQPIQAERKGTDRGLAQGMMTGEEKEKPGEMSYTVSLSQSARQDLRSLLKAEASSSLHPRKLTPHASQVESPRRAGPSTSLDLSDTDSEIAFKSPDRISKPGSPPEVLLVDATRQKHGHNDTEIDIEMSYVQSPAKVICHTPNKVHGNLRDSGDVGQAMKVNMDTLHPVSIVSGPDSLEQREEELAQIVYTPLSDNLHKSARVIRENVIAGSPGKNGEPVRKPAVVQHLFSSGSQDHSSDQSLSFSMHKPVTSLTKSISELSLNSIEEEGSAQENIDPGGGSVISDNSDVISGKPTADEIKQKLISRAAPKMKSAALNTSAIRKKKKPTRVVQSRFLQSATPSITKKEPMKATDRSIMTKPSVTSKRTKPGSGQKVPTPSKKTSKMSSSLRTQSSFSTTPEIKGQGGKVSTPTTDGSLFVAPGVVDVSVIGPVHTHSTHHHSLGSTPGLHDSHSGLSISRTGVRSKTPGIRSFSEGESRHQDYSHTSDSHKRKPAAHVTQKQLDLTYARYLQWVFLNAKARKAFQEQEKKVMDQLDTLAQENESLAQYSHDLDVELARLEHQNRLDAMLETQSTGLEALADSVPRLKTQYSTLAKALDTTRHQMSARGVYVPADEEQYKYALVRALAESEELLGQLNAMVRPGGRQIASLAEILCGLEQSVGAELQEIAKCKELLAAAQTLTTQESSLHIQEMQQRELE